MNYNLANNYTAKEQILSAQARHGFASGRGFGLGAAPVNKLALRPQLGYKGAILQLGDLVMHLITLYQMAPPVYTGPGARSPNIVMDSLTLDADAPGSVARIGEYVRDTLARGYIVEASAAPTETQTEPAA